MALRLSTEKRKQLGWRNRIAVCHKAGERISGKRELSAQPVAIRSPGRARAETRQYVR